MTDEATPQEVTPVTPEPVLGETGAPVEIESSEEITPAKKSQLPIAALLAVILIGAVGGYLVTHSSAGKAQNSSMVGNNNNQANMPGMNGQGGPNGNEHGIPGVVCVDAKGKTVALSADGTCAQGAQMKRMPGGAPVRCSKANGSVVSIKKDGTCPTGTKMSALRRISPFHDPNRNVCISSKGKIRVVKSSVKCPSGYSEMNAGRPHCEKANGTNVASLADGSCPTGSRLMRGGPMNGNTPGGFNPSGMPSHPPLPSPSASQTN